MSFVQILNTLPLPLQLQDSTRKNSIEKGDENTTSDESYTGFPRYSPELRFRKILNCFYLHCYFRPELGQKLIDFPFILMIFKFTNNQNCKYHNLEIKGHIYVNFIYRVIHKSKFNRIILQPSNNLLS